MREPSRTRGARVTSIAGLSGRVLLATLWASAFYHASEWLFFATKPSVLSALDLGQSARVLICAPLPLFIACALPVVAFSAAAVALAGGTARAAWLPASIPAAILAGAALLLVDNFTYTVLGFGIVTTGELSRYAYGVLLLVLFGLALRALHRRLQRRRRWTVARRAGVAVSTGLVALSSAGLALEAGSAPALGAMDEVSAAPARRSNVLVFSMDGVSAVHTSAYGYPRDTTPHLKSLLPDSLVFENHFSNSAKTTGAIGALLTGKLPTTTRVIFRPDAFQGVHAYQHLPGLLRSHGFSTGDFTVRHYGDARDLNLREGFDHSVGRERDWGRLLLPRWAQRSFPLTSSFLNESYDRLGDRIAHAFGVRDLENVHAEVAAPSPESGTDRQRVEALKGFLRTANRPFFAHTHLLTTHGPRFPSENRVFSTAQNARRRWRRNSRDDAILQIDRYLAEVTAVLKEQGIAEATLIVVTSDHGYRWSTLAPIPLVMRFPERAHVGVRTANSQRIDIAPTILDFLDIPRPEWMEGRSLLTDPIDPLAPIVAVSRAKSEEVDGWRQLRSSRPPFYSMGEIYVYYCDVQFRMRLPRGELRRESVRGHTARCPSESIPSTRRAREFLVEHLASAGYDVSGLASAPDGRGR